MGIIHLNFGSRSDTEVKKAILTIGLLVFFKSEPSRGNHLIGFAFLVAAVYFMFKK